MAITLKRKAILDFYESLNTWSSLIISDTYYSEKDRLENNKLLFEKIHNSNVDAFIKFESLFLFLPHDPLENLCKTAFAKLYNMEEGLASLCTTLPCVYEAFTDDIETGQIEVKKLLEAYADELLPKVLNYRQSNISLIKYLDEQLKETFKKQGA